MFRKIRLFNCFRLFVLNASLILLTGCSGQPAGSPAKSIFTTAPSSEPTATPVPTPGQVRTDTYGIEQVWVPSGSFLMGTDEESINKLRELNPSAYVTGEFPSEQPQHTVRITKGYWIDKFEVTNKAFRAFVNDGGYENQSFWSTDGWDWLSKQSVNQLPVLCLGNLPEHPIVFVTWYEAEAYARWRGGRLPTEAEWEYAARGPESFVYPWENEFDSSLCNVVCSKETKPVGSYPKGASWVGACDMVGNVMEWVQDWLADYSADAVDDPAGPAAGKIKVEKGGWWGSNMFVARSAYRHFEDPPDYGDSHIGFRIVTP